MTDSKTITATYTTEGGVRGNCGHRHRSIGAAYACIRDDQRGCASQGGYSDRDIVRCDSEALTAWELDELDAIIDAEVSR